MADPTHIVVRNAREHNLRGVDVEVPRGALVVFTGVSGSGKSSLAFDTLHQEGQRRFVESLSSYARQFLGQSERPKVDLVEGISATVCIDQKTVNRNPRSTVGTVTEVHDHLRLLWARLGQPHCPRCGAVVDRVGLDQVREDVLNRATGRKVMVLGPIVRERKGEFRQEIADLQRDGWTRLRVNGAVCAVDEVPPLARYEKHTLEVVVDRLVPGPDEFARLGEALETAARLGEGIVHVYVAAGETSGEDLHAYSTERACPRHPDLAIPELEPRTFSFNAPQGACPSCEGLGAHEAFVPERLVDVDKAVPDAFLAWNDQGKIPFTHFDRDAALAIAARIGGKAAKKPLRDWPADARERMLRGDPDLTYTVAIDRDGRTEVRERPWLGFVGLIEEVWRWTQWPALHKYRHTTPCDACEGTRLNPVARAVTFRGRALPSLSGVPIRDLRRFFAEITLDEHEATIAAGLLAEIQERLGFLADVGLGYLSLDRSAATLSGGEAQRIRLAAQVGAALQGVTYVLDEPSIGLHPRDNARLLATLRRLRDRGNTVLVVEHDAETILAADWVVELGPGAGVRGGEITASCPGADFLRADTLTAQWMRGQRHIPVATRRPRGKARLTLRGASSHNLRGVDVEVPLGLLIGVSGVSGSGKSTLVFNVLEPALRAILDARGKPPPPKLDGCAALTGVEHLESCVTIDQSPIGRTPRSNPATYTGAMDVIRDLFAGTEESRARGYKKGRFSFNVAGGRCEACEGAGVRVIEMQFLPDVSVPCDTCGGDRFNPETLEITWKGKNIRDVLAMSLGEAQGFFAAVPRLKRVLETLVSVGLDYVTLGQPATTLSGGEAQRLKLASELQRPQHGKTLYLLDEPTTGLHFEDVARLIDAMQRLVDAGNTVLVVEHHGDVLKVCDHLIDLGPDGGDAGGQIVGVGTPEQLATMDTPTGLALRALPDLGGPSWVSDSGPPPAPFSPPPIGAIRVRGARQNNLQGLDADLPHQAITVITGPSGSGKTSLAFDTLFAEGQRRYVESLSTYARRFLGRMERAPVDVLDGLAPAIAIDQRHASHNPRSTVATVTEIHDALRLLYARVGIPHCPACDRRIEALPPSLAAQRLRAVGGGAGWILARLGRAAAPSERRKSLLAAGFARLWLAGEEIDLDAPEADAALAGGGASLVVDRLDPKKTPAARVAEAVASAQRIGGGSATFVPRGGGEPLVMSESPTCPEHGSALPAELTPRHFSFNARLGACARCEGVGHVRAILAERLFPEPGKGLFAGMDGRVRALVERSARLRAQMVAVCERLGLSLSTPWGEWPPPHQHALLHGLAGELPVRWERVWGRTRQVVDEKFVWDGLIRTIEGWNARLEWLVAETPCPACGGGRLRPELLAVKLGGMGIHALCALSVQDARRAVAALSLDGAQAAIAERPLAEVSRRLAFLDDVGLGYLHLDRAAETLSGGESQRIRLSSQIGSGLVGVIYVLDEPTVGLHPRDTAQLLRTLEGLRDLGNTLVVVEHDPDTIRRADHVLDIGPGAGRFGGKLVASGTPAEIAANPASPTGRWLSGAERIPLPSSRRPGRASITLREPRGHNLRGGEYRFPTGAWTAITGVSGSGKSTLVMDTLAPALRARLGEDAIPGPHRAFDVGEAFDRVVCVDQQPIGRTPRSTPATYVGVMDPLRALFAETPGARERGWAPGRFSFNAAGGRCEVCEGRGATLVEMHFLPDVWVVCEACGGRRYNHDTLAVRYKDRNIADVLAMRIDEAAALFENVRALARPLRALVDVGLGYLSLGQPGNTLSGGEAQRVKLAAELGARKGHAIYILDEPTTGLHLSDVARLVTVLHQLVEQGHTVLTIEHHLDMIAQADHVIELGPDGGAGGGLQVAQGTPEVVMGGGTATGVALASHFQTEPSRPKTPRRRPR